MILRSPVAEKFDRDLALVRSILAIVKHNAIVIGSTDVDDPNLPFEILRNSDDALGQKPNP